MLRGVLLLDYDCLMRLNIDILVIGMFTYQKRYISLMGISIVVLCP